MVLRNENNKKSAKEGRDDRFVGTNFFVLERPVEIPLTGGREKVEIGG